MRPLLCLFCSAVLCKSATIIHCVLLTEMTYTAVLHIHCSSVAIPLNLNLIHSSLSFFLSEESNYTHSYTQQVTWTRPWRSTHAVKQSGRGFHSSDKLLQLLKRLWTEMQKASLAGCCQPILGKKAGNSRSVICKNCKSYSEIFALWLQKPNNVLYLALYKHTNACSKPLIWSHCCSTPRTEGASHNNTEDFR